MDHDGAGLTGIPPRGLWNVMAKGENMAGLTIGTRVFFGPTDTEAVGTVIDDTPNREGLIVVRWDGIGTYTENPVNLRAAAQ